jgi:hypothetical protein
MPSDSKNLRVLASCDRTLVHARFAQFSLAYLVGTMVAPGSGPLLQGRGHSM